MKGKPGFAAKLRPSENGYFYVKKITRGKYIQWEAKITNRIIIYHSYHATEKEAAIAVDKILIKNGYEPINVLKQKQPE
jgi:hypothetical protein